MTESGVLSTPVARANLHDRTVIFAASRLTGGADGITLRVMIDMSIDIAAPIDRTWSCLTSPAHLRHWWNENVTLDAVPGGRFEEPGTATGGSVLDLKDQRELRLTWAGPDWPIETEVTIRLDRGDAHTRLMLTHGGWSAFPEDDRAHLIATHRAGWDRHLKSLAAYATGSAH